MDELEELLGERRLARQVYDYWAAKRAAEGGPLLSQLWFEEPWRVRAAGREGYRGTGGGLSCSSRGCTSSCGHLAPGCVAVACGDLTHLSRLMVCRQPQQLVDLP
jgi:hypothetical protein